VKLNIPLPLGHPNRTCQVVFPRHPSRPRRRKRRPTGPSFARLSPIPELRWEAPVGSPLSSIRRAPARPPEHPTGQNLQHASFLPIFRPWPEGPLHLLALVRETSGTV